MYENKDFLLGRLEGNRLHMRLSKAIKQHTENLDILTLLPDMQNKSIAYKRGFKAAVLEDVLPQTISLFHASSRSTCERLRLMDEILSHLRQQA
jgi:hypothetical protein